MKASHPSGIAILLQAQEIDETMRWLNSGVSLRMPALRAFSSFVMQAMRTDPSLQDVQKLPNCLRDKDDQLAKSRSLRQLLEDNFLRLVHAGTTPG